jgi:hypothetical protein
MNERIRQLLNQATSGLEPDLSLQRTVTLNEMQKFAELIVQECIDVLNKRFMGDLNREDMEVRRCIADVKKHFGVEK